MNELAIEHWVGRRGFYDNLVCLNVSACMESTDPDAVADAMRGIMHKPYTATDTRLMLERATDDPEELAALVRINTLFKLLRNPDLTQAVIQATEQGYDEHWVGYARTFIRELNDYQAQLKAIVTTYKAALAALPDLIPPLDFTAVVSYPGKPGQPEVVETFIRTLMHHFTLPDRETLMVPHPDCWSLSDYIVVRILEENDAPVVMVLTEKGVIALNAQPESPCENPTP